jgi:phenylalanyl-tRNA synthetase alpha chain
MDEANVLEREGRSRLEAANDAAALEEARVAVLGRSSPLTVALRELAGLDPDVRRTRGAELNGVRRELEALHAARHEAMAKDELERRLREDAVDVSLPGEVIPRGVPHVLSQLTRELEDIFIGLGYRVAEGPEVELEHYSFTALNIPDDHPAKSGLDTLWVEGEGVSLRPHTSPVQVRAMELQGPPLYVVVPGRTYRRDALDATHSPMFQQLEGLAVDRGLTLGDLKGTLEHVARALFGEDRQIRLRSSFFPFTEPSVELDVSCFQCGGVGCRMCKHSGWIEILGAGMVDPNVYGFVDGYDPEEISGFAFGMGIERIALLRYGIEHIRSLYDDDLRFLEQFAGAVI